MNTITELFNGYSPAEQAALQPLHDQLAPEWDVATDADAKGALELAMTEALNAYREGGGI